MNGRAAGLLSGGCFTALPTPFRAGAVDCDSLARLCERQVDRGTAALVVCGSTGEAASNPIPSKAALWLLGVMEAELRLPLTAPSRDTSERLAMPRAAVRAVQEALPAPIRYRLAS